MEKQLLNGFISKYNLSGFIESVSWNSDGNTLKTSFVSDDKSMLGSVSIDDMSFPEGDFGIYTTSQLKQLISVLQDNIEAKSTESSVVFFDKSTKVNYMLAASSVIPQVPELKQLPNFNVEIPLDGDFIDRFVKSKSALSDIDTFTFTCKDNNGEIILGYSSINSNRISLSVDCTCDGDVSPISFSSKYLRAILLANKDLNTSSMKISTDGLLHITFEGDGYTSEYYLVEIKS